MHTKYNKKWQSTIALSDTPDGAFAGSNLPEEHSANNDLHLLDAAEVVLKLEEVLLLESILTKDDLHKSPQQQDL